MGCFWFCGHLMIQRCLYFPLWSCMQLCSLNYNDVRARCQGSFYMTFQTLVYTLYLLFMGLCTCCSHCLECSPHLCLLLLPIFPSWYNHYHNSREGFSDLHPTIRLGSPILSFMALLLFITMFMWLFSGLPSRLYVPWELSLCSQGPIVPLWCLGHGGYSIHIVEQVSKWMNQQAPEEKVRARKSAKNSENAIINDTELEDPGEGGNGREEQQH